MQSNSYLHNPLIHKDRRLSRHASTWGRSFSCEHLRPLIVCRGPIRKEAMDVFEEMGIIDYGILLSEKDSIVYTHALAPELRKLNNPKHVHRVPDYSGATRDERMQRIDQIIAIAHENQYNSIFAGYGFMAEDETFVNAIEEAGLIFIGPCSRTVRGAGRKDEAKRTALAEGVSVTPGVDNITALTLLAECPDKAALRKKAVEAGLDVDEAVFAEEMPLEDAADAVLEASYVKGIDLISVAEIAARVGRQVAETWRKFPGSRIRLKAIGGGGGKGQRILAAPEGEDEAAVAEAVEPVAAAVREVLGEVKATGVGDNKNMLIELNIEYTRHQEIQLVGNGKWCVALGARDCSLQMHEQKLLEISVTREALASAIAGCEVHEERAALKADLDILLKMEEESARFGEAVGLDSVSTFECIVDHKRHFFMEMNTRIQVEHRVTELCYALKFRNLEDPQDFFVVDALVEVMVLLAAHKARLPKPERVPREGAAVEARLNATNGALAPHAGGLITFWSDPLPGEIRDDQGICLKNPDTDSFVKYRLAGAYDSNVALLVTSGTDRAAAYQTLNDVLRRTKLQGVDLDTNLEFHYGLLCWFQYRNPFAKATTSFVMPYLTLVGLLKQVSDQVDLNWAFGEVMARAHEGRDPEMVDALDQAMERKRSLILRPLQALLEKPHVFSGWLSCRRKDFSCEKGQLVWLRNPLRVLADTYHFLNMDWRKEALPAEKIWDHDQAVLERGLQFYDALTARLGIEDYPELCARLDREEIPEGLDGAQWDAARSAHRGFCHGLQLLSLLPLLAEEVGFYELRLEKDLCIHIPERLTDKQLQARMAKVLVPPPVSGADEIVAASGGMFYPREAPGMDPFIKKGGHFEKGDPLYIIEVMKMFNKVYAPFAGTIDDLVVDGDGVIVAKGDPLFKVTPDERIEPPDVEVLRAQKRDFSKRLAAGI